MGGPNKCQNGRCFIPKGTFKMGSPKGVGYRGEHPQRKVTQSAFWLKKTEVTIGEYRKYLEETTGVMRAVLSGCVSSLVKKVVKANKRETQEHLERRARKFLDGKQYCSITLKKETPKGMPDFDENKKGDNYPVVGLMHDERRAYCQAQGGDLPTAAQIERAAKGKSGTDKYGTPIDKAIVLSNRHRSTAPVCGPNDERANSFGVCDLAGNVWETTRDAYDEDFYLNMPAKDPHKPLTDPDKQYVEFRGGSWNDDRRVARAADRNGDGPGFRSSIVGFRCAWPQDSKK